MTHPVAATAPPKVTLVGVSGLPTCMVSRMSDISGNQLNLGVLHVIAIIWNQSKTTDPLDKIIEDVLAMSATELSALMESVMQGVPVVEAVSFNFIIENASIGWREQMVRHRVGTKPDIRVGADWLTVDTIPEQADMSAWSQSMRLLDMSTFQQRGAYRTPDAVIAMEAAATPWSCDNCGKACRKAIGPEGRCADCGGCDMPLAQWHRDMATIEAMYSRWASQGLPLEDARDLIPLGATSRLSWTINLRTLQHIVGKRGCTILQLGYWGPIINGMITELVTKVHPCFGALVTPPCMRGNKYTGCIFPEDIQRRFDGRDHNLPVCPLFIGRDSSPLGDQCRAAFKAGTIRLMSSIEEEALRRATFWHRNPLTGERLGNQDPATATINALSTLRTN